MTHVLQGVSSEVCLQHPLSSQSSPRLITAVDVRGNIKGARGCQTVFLLNPHPDVGPTRPTVVSASESQASLLIHSCDLVLVVTRVDDTSRDGPRRPHPELDQSNACLRAI